MQSIWLWTITIILSATVMVYQGITDPTTPVRRNIEYLDQTIKYRMLRTWGGNHEWQVLVLKNNNGVLSTIYFIPHSILRLEIDFTQ